MSYSPQFPSSSAKYEAPRLRFASARTIFALILREMATTYGRSPGGYLWAILEPVAGIALLTVVFSAAFTSPALGISFPLFYSTGMLPFLLFIDVSNKVALSLGFSRPLLAYPSVTFVDAILARFLLNLLTQLLVCYAILAAIILLSDTRIVPDYPVIIEGFLLMALLALGIGVLNCYMFTRFDVWHRVWAIVMRPMFIVSGIFYTFESMPERFQAPLWFNPLVHVIGVIRRGFYSSYDASYVSEMMVICVSLVCFLIGLFMLRGNYRNLLDS